MAQDKLTDLIKAMKEAQGVLTLTAFAEKIGISQPYLSMIYNTQRVPGRKVLAGLVQAFPETLDAVGVFLSQNITESVKKA